MIKIKENNSKHIMMAVIIALLILTAIMLLIANNAIGAVISTEPVHQGTEFPAGINTISMTLDNLVDINQVTIDIEPPVACIKSFDLVRRIDLQSEYYEPRVICESTEEFLTDTLYTVTVTGDGLNYTWEFNTSNPVSFQGETLVVTYANASRQKPNIAICPDKYVTIWQDPADGVIAQMYLKNGTPFGAEILIAGNYYYNDNARPALDMSNNCEWVAGVENDYRSNFTNISRVFKIFDSDGNLTHTKYVDTVFPDQVRQNPQAWTMQFDSGGVGVAINDARVVVLGYQNPTCYYGYFGWSCDNAIKGLLGSGLNPQSYEWLGNNQAGNVWAPFAGTTVNIPPYWNGGSTMYGDSAGCGNPPKGAAYDCAYHMQVSMSDTRISFSWGEYGGNSHGNGWNTNGDNMVGRIFDINGNALTGELPLNQSFAQYGNWQPACDSSTNNITFCVWSNMMAPSPIQSDIYGRFYQDGTPLTGEFAIHSKRMGDQYNPTVKWDGFHFVVSWMSNGTDAGGYGIYAIKYGEDMLSFGNEFRVNNYNEIPLDTFEGPIPNPPGTGESKTTWSVPTGLGCNDGSCAFTYMSHDQLDGNGISHSVGYSVFSNLLLTEPPIPVDNVNPFDVNFDWIIDDTELLNAIDQWAAGNLGDFELLDIIDLWAAGCYQWNASTQSYEPGCTGDTCTFDQPVRTVGVPPGYMYYSSLQSGYDAAGDGDTIQSQDKILTGDLNINKNISVNLEGGYDCDYTAITGQTEMKGQMWLSNGTLTLNNGTFVVGN